MAYCNQRNPISQKKWISRNWPKQGPTFHKLQEAIWLTVINEIFKFPPRLGPFSQINYLPQLFSGYPSYPIQKWYIWASFHTSRKRFGKLQEAICLTVINEIFIFYHISTPFLGKLFVWTLLRLPKRPNSKMIHLD